MRKLGRGEDEDEVEEEFDETGTKRSYVSD